MDLNKIKQLQAAAKEYGADLTKPSGGGSDFAVAVEGPTRMRLVGYVEYGVHTTKSGNATKTKPRAMLTFELSGPLHPPVELEDGRKIPLRVTIKEIVGTTPKNNYIKLFNLMKGDYPDATNFLDLMGKAFTGDISHYKFKGSNGAEVVLAQLRTKAGYQIGGLGYLDRESGQPKKLKVDAPLLPLTVFLWDLADVEQWDGIKIEGTYDDGSTKNKLQELIKKAENFVGSPVYEALVEAGREAELVPAVNAAKDEEPEEEEAETPAKQEAPAKAPASPVAAPKAAGKAKVAKAPPKASKAGVEPPAEEPSDEDDGDPLAGV